MSTIYDIVWWEQGDSSGIFYNRDIRYIQTVLIYLGHERRKWYEFWKPQLRVIGQDGSGRMTDISENI